MGILDGLFGGQQAQAPGQGLLGQSWGGFTGRVSEMAQKNPEALYGLAAGLLRGEPQYAIAAMGDEIGKYRQREAQAGLQREGWDRADARFDKTFGLQQAEHNARLQAMGTEQAQRKQQINQTIKWAESTGDPDVIGLAGAGMFDEAFKVWNAKNTGAGGAKVGLNLFYGTDASGNIIPLQAADDGRAVRTEIPDGITPLSPYDLNRDKAAGTSVGKGVGEAQVKAPAQIESADQTISLIDDILDDPGLSAATGPMQGMMPSFRESTINAEAKIEQLKGRAFADAIQAMVGLGALSDAEGKAILAGAARLDYRQGDAGFQASLRDLRTQVQRGRDRAMQILAGGSGRIQAQRPGPVNVGGYTIEQVD